MAESQVRIFVSSPSDLDHERALVKEIVDGLAQEYLPYFNLQAVLWEEEALTAAQSFQAGLVRPSACEIVLVMLWTRLGTPLADDPYGGLTGTEWEFVDAVEGSARAGTPEVLVYRKTTPRLIDITNAEATREAVADRDRMEAFFRQHFFNPDGSFSRAFRQFNSDRALRELVEGQVRKLLNRRISVERGQRQGLGEWNESPFRAGTHFEAADEPVFVGRETETRELVARLDAFHGEGRGLLLITGPSGVGKSSLVRAGLLPRLMRPYLFAGVAGCRWCLLESLGPDPLGDLTRALLAPSLLGSALDGFGLDPAGLKRLFETEPTVAAGQVQAALGRVTASDGRPGSTVDGRLQLALILDPLDGLFTPAALESPATQAFAAALAALAAQDGVWVVATLRGDLLREVPRIPALAGLLDERSWYPLAPPPPARIRQVIEIPARVARIEYEGETGRSLVDLLEAEASDLEHWPALLEPLLAGLYDRAQRPGAASGAMDDRTAEADNGEVPGETAARLRLRISDYQALGGIRGSIRQRAEQVWQGLDAAAQAALPMLCRALIALEGGAAAPVPREGDLRVLERDPGCARLIGALIEARLVAAGGVPDPSEQVQSTPIDYRFFAAMGHVLRQTRDEWRARLFPKQAAAAVAQGGRGLTSEDTALDAQPTPAGGGPVVQWRDFRPAAVLVHPALIEAWAPVRDWLADPANRRDLQLRFQITRQARLWKRTDCNPEYLLGEIGYAAAHRFAGAFPGELEPVEAEYLQRSHEHLRYQRRRNRWVRLAGLALMALLGVASVFAYRAREASWQADLSRHHSQIDSANLAIADGNTPVAVRLALAAGYELPGEATETLSRALGTNRLISLVRADAATTGKARSINFSDDGSRLLTLTTGGGAALWRLADNRLIRDRQLALPESPIQLVRIGSDGTQPLFLGIGETGVWRLPAVPGGGPDWPCGLVGEQAPYALTPARDYLALGRSLDDGTFGVCLLDLRHPGQPLWIKPLHRKDIRSIAFAPDGLRLVTASRDGTAQVIDTLTGEVLRTLKPADPKARVLSRAVFDSRGVQVAVTTGNDRVSIFDGSGQERRVLGEVKRGHKVHRVHQSQVTDLAFGANDRYLLAGDEEGQLVRWDLNGGDYSIIGQHRLSIASVRVSPGIDPRTEERMVLTASRDKTVRLWGLDSGRELALFSHDGAVKGARFSPDGQRVLSFSEQDGTARIWSVEPTSPLAQRLPHADHVSHLDLVRMPPGLTGGPDAFLLASASWDGEVRLWRYDPGAPGAAPEEMRQLEGHEGRARRVAFSPSGRQLASAGFDSSVRVWDMITGGACVLRPQVGAAAEATGAAGPGTAGGAPIEFSRAVFAPNERWLLTTSNEPGRSVRLWEPSACRELPLPVPLGGESGVVTAAAAAPASGGAQQLALGTDKGVFLLLTQAPDGSWSERCRRELLDDAINDVAFAPDGGAVAAVGKEGRGALVDLAASDCGEPLSLPVGKQALTSVRFARDGAALVTTSQSGEAQVWNRDGARLANLVGHQDRLYSAEFSPDGRWILTASRDGEVRLWRRPESRPAGSGVPAVEGSYLVLEAGLGAARVAGFSPDGNSVAVAYRQNAVVLWRVWEREPTADPGLLADWGPERSRLALIREALRFSRDNGLEVLHE